MSIGEYRSTRSMHVAPTWTVLPAAKLAVRSVITNCSAICRLLNPRVSSAMTSCSRAVSTGDAADDEYRRHRCGGR